MTDFEPAERLWIDRFGNLRNVIRQEMIGRQLAANLPSPGTVLDVGCGQGEHLLRLMDAGWQATGFDKSIELLDLFNQASLERGHQPETVVGPFGELSTAIGRRTFDLVCAHGLLMYLPDSRNAIAALGKHVAKDGRLSITVRNGDALAWKPGLRQDWQQAMAAFDSLDYINDLGLPARAHRLQDISDYLADTGFEVAAWFGVRVFHEGTSPDATVPDAQTLAALLDAEEKAGATDPYRHLGGQLHIVASRR